MCIRSLYSDRHSYHYLLAVWSYKYIFNCDESHRNKLESSVWIINCTSDKLALLFWKPHHSHVCLVSSRWTYRSPAADCVCVTPPSRLVTAAWWCGCARLIKDCDNKRSRMQTSVVTSPCASASQALLRHKYWYLSENAKSFQKQRVLSHLCKHEPEGIPVSQKAHKENTFLPNSRHLHMFIPRLCHVRDPQTHLSCF